MHRADDEDGERHRLDRWLWFVRFYKSRSLATQAVQLGRVLLNGQRVRPAHEIRIGDRIELHRDREIVELTVRHLAERRGPAPEAQSCYAESEDSIARRSAAREQRRFGAMSAPQPEARPDKRDRRLLQRLRRQD